ncbi:MAG: hypothetical protein PHX68_03890 [Alphaproteobacteria bacterium]|nr:hypothetical protein [Alphaproteobacteria bacterium]
MLNFIITNIETIIVAITSIISGASALSALTPKKTGSDALNSVKKGLDVLALNIANARTK